MWASDCMDKLSNLDVAARRTQVWQMKSKLCTLRFVTCEACSWSTVGQISCVAYAWRTESGIQFMAL